MISQFGFGKSLRYYEVLIFFVTIVIIFVIVFAILFVILNRNGPIIIFVIRSGIRNSIRNVIVVMFVKVSY